MERTKMVEVIPEEEVEYPCAQKDRIGDACDDEGDHFKVPFIFGSIGMCSTEWWCESCIEQGLGFQKDGDTVWVCNPKGERLATAEETLATDGDVLEEDN